MNGILLHHNIEKQMSDSRGEVAYLMADISEVKESEIRDLFQSLQELSCKFKPICSHDHALISSQHASEQEYCTKQSVVPTRRNMGRFSHQGRKAKKCIQHGVHGDAFSDSFFF